MTIYEVYDQNSWGAISDLIAPGDTISIISDFQYTFAFGVSHVIHSLTDIILEGNNHTITIQNNFKGIVKLYGGTIQNLNIDGGYYNVYTDSGGLIYPGDDQYGNITNFKIRNLILNSSYTGSILCDSFGNITTESILNKCGVDDVILNGREVGGIGVRSTRNITIQNSYFNGSVSDNVYILGGFFSEVIGPITISNCYVNIKNTIDNNIEPRIGGFIYNNRPLLSYPINISNSYVNMTINNSGNIGGFIWQLRGTTCNINDCYFAGSTLENSSGFAGAVMMLEQNINTDINLNVTNFYSLNTIGYSIFISGGNFSKNTITIKNVVSNGTPFAQSTIRIIDDGSSTDVISTIDQAIYTNWDSNVWSPGTGVDGALYPTLNTFEGTSGIWDDSYIAYNSTPTFATGGGGDPHIKTLSGKYYNFNKNGFYRYFQNEDETLTINTFIDHPNIDGFYDKLFFQTLYIKYMDSELIIKTGFRGEKVKIINSKGTHIKYKFIDKNINKHSRQYCVDCKEQLKNNDISLHKDVMRHNVLDKVRNQLYIDMGQYIMRIENVSAYNSQPSRVLFTTLDKKEYKKSNGLIVDPKWNECIDINGLFDLEKCYLNNKYVSY